jgi:hypothetical protein
MRLLQYDNEGTLSLTKYFQEDEIPPYAILSHTWEDGEILFRDLEEGRHWFKAGYHKLDFCRKQAANDGLKYFWVDTCCINKSSSAELQEAIISMFSWYRNAAKCYVYLTDVTMGDNLEPAQTEIAFRNSRWFTRSWTLPELLAPKVVEFYTSDGRWMGDKASMLAELHAITRIPQEAIQGSPLSQFSVEERMSWASSRRATRIEDEVYSMLGILHVFMPLIYGEGVHAKERLKEELEKHHRVSVPAPLPERAGRQHLLVQHPTTTMEDNHPSTYAAIEDLPSKVSSAVPFYRPLTPDGFRLLILAPGNLGSTITGRIQEFDLSNPPPYYALSYVWGQEPALHRVIMNDAVILIRPNLFHALQRIRALQRVQFSLWVDSLSIDQLNATERNDQVLRMAQIYNKASGVFVWLGEEDATSTIAIELVTKLYDDGQRNSANLACSTFSWSDSWWKDYSFTALSLLLERPWFRRGWVLQEAAFSTNSILQCGDRQLHMNHFAEVTKLIRSRISVEPQTTGLLSNLTQVGTLVNFVDSPAVRLLDLIEGAFSRTIEGVISGHELTLETLVHMSTFSETSNERDAIYALLNLANDARTIIPDYRKSIISVYSDFIMHCYAQNDSLDVLCRPWAPVLSTQGWASSADNQESIQLPTWICSRDKLPYGEPSWRLKHRLHGNPLVGGSSKRVYNARVYNANCGTLPAIVKAPTGHQPHILALKGIIVADIDQRSSRMASAIVTQECLMLLGNPENSSGAEYERKIGAWWRTLCANRDEKGDPAPNSWQTAMEETLDLLNGDTISSIDIEELLDTDIPEHIRRYLLVVRDVVWNRRTFRSDMGPDGEHLVGLIPPNARNGDRICILYGCSVPVVLRKHECPDQELYWELVGDAYVHGIMDGEFLDKVSEYTLQDKEWVFEIR